MGQARRSPHHAGTRGITAHPFQAQLLLTEKARSGMTCGDCRVPGSFVRKGFFFAPGSGPGKKNAFFTTKFSASKNPNWKPPVSHPKVSG